MHTSILLAYLSSGSRNRTPLPPQSAIYSGSKASDLDTGCITRPSATEAQVGSLRERNAKVVHLDNVIPTSDHHASQHTSTRGSSSLPSTTDRATDHTEYDRPRNPRRGKPRSQADSYVPNESSIAKERYPDSMDIDDAPPRPPDFQRHPLRRAGDEHGGPTTLDSSSSIESSRLRGLFALPLLEHWFTCLL